MINSHWLSKSTFWFLIAFYSFRLVVSGAAYYVWKKDFKALYGNANPCFNPFMPNNARNDEGVPLTGRRADSGN